MPITRAVSRLADLGRVFVPALFTLQMVHLTNFIPFLGQNINDKDFLAISVSLSDGGGTGGWISPLMVFHHHNILYYDACTQL